MEDMNSFVNQNCISYNKINHVYEENKIVQTSEQYEKIDKDERKRKLKSQEEYSDDEIDEEETKTVQEFVEEEQKKVIEEYNALEFHEVKNHLAKLEKRIPKNETFHDMDE